MERMLFAIIVLSTPLVVYYFIYDWDRYKRFYEVLTTRKYRGLYIPKGVTKYSLREYCGLSNCLVNADKCPPGGCKTCIAYKGNVDISDDFFLRARMFNGVYIPEGFTEQSEYLGCRSHIWPSGHFPCYSITCDKCILARTNKSVAEQFF